MITKNYAIIVLLLCSTCAFAQPVLTGANSNPVIGDKYYRHSANKAGVILPTNGTGMFWNYNNLVEQSVDSTSFISCATYPPDCASYPGTTVVSSAMVGSYYYYKTDAAEYAALYKFIGSTTIIDTFTLLKYPFTYNDSFTDSFTYSFGGDTLLSINHTDAVGYGTLVLPSGIYHDVLLLHNTYTRIVRYATPSSNTYTQQHTYNWNKEGIHYPVLSISADTMGGTALVPKFVNFFTDPLHPTAIGNISGSAGYINISPNPVGEDGLLHITFSSEIMNEDRVVITDVTGREILASSCEKYKMAPHELSLTIPRIPTGIYLLCLQTRSGNAVTKLVR